MMKRYFLRGMAALLFALMASSCYEDLSTEATTSIPEIVITVDSDVLNVYYGEEITLEPGIMQKGRTQNDFTYLWEIDLTPSTSSDRLEIGTERTLNYKVGNTPSTNPYELTLTVTDTKTGLAAVQGWQVYVSSSLGEGLVVAYTRDGGKTSDMDLVASSALTYGYTADSPRYTRELYALANDKALEGRIQTLSSIAWTNGAVYNEHLLMAGTEKDMLGIDPLTFKVSRRNGDFFNLAPGFTDFNMTTFFCFASYSAGTIVNGKLFFSLCGIDDYLSPANYNVSPYEASAADVAYGKQSQDDLFHFESSTGKFYMLNGWNASQSSLTEQKFNVTFNAVGGKSVAAGAVKDSNYGFIVKDASGAYHLCVMNGDESYYADYAMDTDNLDEMVCSTFCDNSYVFFYSDGTKVYSRVLSGDKIVKRTLSWTPDSEDEKITGLQQYRQAWFGCSNLWSYDFTLDTHRTMILVTTYNEKTGEGKVYLRPYNASTGLFTAKNCGTLSGFGEITALGTTFR